ncbi:MAG: ABC transporter ATP-binding protein [Candidimonas sp.]|nr:MAG: ABC transporter ATP-binding protein [Candidimonas sp.]TAM27145.1 MAG: ABC transporter ATP-binding protein [Candidimonas sp.]
MSLETIDLTLTQGTVPYLQKINTTFERGQLTTVIGRTLAGKTTLLRSIAGLQERVCGTLELDGRHFSSLPPWKRDVAMVYQQFINYPHLSVYENVAFPMRRKRQSDAAIRQSVQQMLDKVGLNGLETRKPSELSGGQQQRVALARALCRKTDILLLDEPLVNLDYKLREQLREEFRDLLVAQSNTIVIYSTTDPTEAIMLGHKVVVMHEGRILQAGSPAEVFDQPACATVARIINDPPMSLFAGILDESSLVLAGGIRIKRTPHMKNLPSGPYCFGIRASELRIDEGTIQGRITFTEVSGSETSLYLDTPCGPLIMQCEGVRQYPHGAQINIDIPAHRLFVFDSSDKGALMSAPLTKIS